MLLSRTPCFGRLYDALPEESRTARVKLVVPQGASADTDLVVHLAGTGDHGFERRLHLGFPLIKQVCTLLPGSKSMRITLLRATGVAEAARPLIAPEDNMVPAVLRHLCLTQILASAFKT